MFLVCCCRTVRLTVSPVPIRPVSRVVSVLTLFGPLSCLWVGALCRWDQDEI